MPVSQEHIDGGTPLGATRVEGGATFRAWAPAARQVFVITDDLPASRAAGWQPRPEDALASHEDGTWTGFVAGLPEGAADENCMEINAGLQQCDRRAPSFRVPADLS